MPTRSDYICTQKSLCTRTVYLDLEYRNPDILLFVSQEKFVQLNLCPVEVASLASHMA